MYLHVHFCRVADQVIVKPLQAHSAKIHSGPCNTTVIYMQIAVGFPFKKQGHFSFYFYFKCDCSA